jgi:hypothetical protein
MVFWQRIPWSPWWAVLFGCSLVFLSAGNIGSFLASLLLLIQKILFDMFVKPFPVTSNGGIKVAILVITFAPPLMVWVLALFVFDMPALLLAIILPTSLFLATSFRILRGVDRKSNQAS